MYVRRQVTFHLPRLEGVSYRNPLSSTHGSRCQLNGMLKLAEMSEYEFPVYTPHTNTIEYFVQCEQHGAWIECPYSLIRDILDEYMTNNAGTEAINDAQQNIYQMAVEQEGKKEEAARRFDHRAPPRNLFGKAWPNRSSCF